MRRFVVAVSAALFLASSAGAVLAAELFVIDRNGAPVYRTTASANTVRRSTLSPGNPHVVRIDDRYAEVYSFEPRRGECVDFVMRSDEVDSVLVVQINGGYEIAKDDDSGGGRDAHIRGTIKDQLSIWVVATTAQPDETGSYTFSASTCDGRELPGPPAPVQPAPQPAPQQPGPRSWQTPAGMI